MRHNFAYRSCPNGIRWVLFFFPPFMLNPSLHTRCPLPLHTPLLKLFKEKLPPRTSLFKKNKYSRYAKLMCPVQQISDSCLRLSGHALGGSPLTVIPHRRVAHSFIAALARLACPGAAERASKQAGACTPP